MIAAPPLSVVRDYAIIDESDDALVSPDVPAEPVRVDGEADEAWSERAAAWATTCADIAEKWRADYKRACETGEWSGMLAPGKAPTIFHVRQIGVSAWSTFKRVARTLGQDEIALLAFRLGVVSISNLALPIKVTHEPHPEPGLGDVMPAAVVDAIAMAPGGRDILLRTGMTIMSQRGAPLGK